jgi:hypothetical protein
LREASTRIKFYCSIVYPWILFPVVTLRGGSGISSLLL